MKKNLLLSTIALLCLILAIVLGVVLFSKDNIENKRNEYEQIDIESPYGKVVVFDGYINNIKLDGTVKGSSVMVQFIGSDLSVQEAQCPVQVKNDDTYALIEREVYAFSILQGEGDELTSAQINPTKINVNYLVVFFTFLTPFVLAWTIINCVEDRVALKKDIFAMKRYKYLLYDLVLRDIKTKYRRSALGVLWSVLNPLLMMIVLTAVFSQIIRVEVEGGFALFYLTGYLIFSFINESSNFSLVSIINAGGLIKKVYIPKYIFPLEKTIFSLVNMVFSLSAFVVVFTIFLITGKVELHATMLLFFVPMIYVFVFAFGLNLILSALNLFFRDVGHIWGVFMTVWMYATPILYPITLVPSWLQAIIKLNPLYYYVTYFRNIMIYGTLPSLEENLICIAFSLMFFAIGMVSFRKHQDKFILHM